MENLTAILLMALAAQVICAPQVKRQSDSPSTIRSLVNLSLAELKYILSVRNGEYVDSPKTLTPCARAILSCCSGSLMNERCSEDLKCGAYFFDVNPCDDKFVIESLDSAKTFYNQFNQVQ